MEPNFEVVAFEITITVHENGTTFNVKALNGKPISYQAIIGALESVKLSYVFDQSGINAEAYRKWAAKQKKKTAKKNNPLKQ